MKSFFSVLLVFLFNYFVVFNAFAETIIQAQVVRQQPGSGDTLVSSGFPLPAGLVTEQMIRKGTIRVFINGQEIPVNITALRGRHHDETLRSMLIQFRYDLEQGEVLPATVVVGELVRISPDPAYQRPTLEMVLNNNVILPIDPDYIVSTQITFQNLLPFGAATAEEEKQYSLLAEDRFDHLSKNHNRGSARYEEIKGMFALWSRTGDIKYFNGALFNLHEFWAGYNFPYPGATGKNADITNPDRVGYPNQDHTRERFETGTEAQSPRSQSYAIAYLMTGYRDFWAAVSNLAQHFLSLRDDSASDQKGANVLFVYSTYDTPRFNYQRYAPLFSAMMIESTMPIPTFWAGMPIDEHIIQRAVNALFHHQWDVVWVPFSDWDQILPARRDMLHQGSVSGEILGVYFDTNAHRRADEYFVQQEEEPKEPHRNAQWHRPSDNSWFAWDNEKKDWTSLGKYPTSGFVQVKKSSITGGDFAVGSIESGINAVISDIPFTDYRNGLVGSRSYGSRRHSGIPLFQTIFPANFLIDYYLNIHSDERIPDAVYEITRIVIMNFRELEEGDPRYQSGGSRWGYVTHGSPYIMNFPVSPGRGTWELPEFARMIAFTIKTRGDIEVNGKLLSEWYSICVNTANNTPISNVGGLIWQWKLFGQYYGMSQDAPWMMTQESLIGFGPTKIRKPTQYDAIPGDTPDIARE